MIDIFQVRPLPQALADAGVITFHEVMHCTIPFDRVLFPVTEEEFDL